jgi:hypothetical protein
MARTKSLSRDLNLLKNGVDHLPEVPFEYVEDEILGKNKKVTIAEIVKHNCGDGRRYIKIFAVFYENKAIMICREAGREGRDSYGRFITNERDFHEMVTYLRSILPYEEISDLYNPHEDIEELDVFYGNHMVYWLQEHQTSDRND